MAKRMVKYKEKLLSATISSGYKYDLIIGPAGSEVPYTVNYGEVRNLPNEIVINHRADLSNVKTLTADAQDKDGVTIIGNLQADVYIRTSDHDVLGYGQDGVFVSATFQVPWGTPNMDKIARMNVSYQGGTTVKVYIQKLVI